MQDCETACQIIRDRYMAASERNEEAGKDDDAEMLANIGIGAGKCVDACKALRTERAQSQDSGKGESK